MSKIDEFYLNIENYKIHVLRKLNDSSFPWIIFLHDALGSIETWRSFPFDLIENQPYNALIYSRRGHGMSDKLLQDKGIDIFEKETMELKHLIRTLKLRNVLLIGSSDGGTIALNYASAYNVKSVVSIAGHYINEVETYQGVLNSKKEPFNSNLRIALQKYHYKNTKRLVDSWQNIWTNSAFKSWSLEDKMKKITCPTLILQGKKDEYASENHALSLGKLIKNAVVHLLENTGHFPHKENTEKTKSIIRTYLKDI